MNNPIEAQELVKQYPGQSADSPALAGIDISISQGRLYGLVGPDGAGKTTTLRILSTVMRQTGGSASIMGYDVRKEPESARPQIGYMPQDFSLYPDLSVIENLLFFADIHQVPKERREMRIKELLDFTRLESFLSRRSEFLSGGMRKKLALACALVHEPKVLLLDEPTTGVDPVSRRELWQILSQVLLEGVTILVSTPYMDEAERCHEVGILYEGKFLATGSPAKLESELPFGILEVKARPRRVSRKVVQETPGVVRWRPVGDRLRVAADNPNAALSHIEQELAAKNAEVKIMREAKQTMEDVFIHLVETQREAE